MRDYVVVNRMGGLGNQLFQYAAARAVARAVAYHHPNIQVYVEEEKDNIHNHKGYDYAKIFMKDAIVCGTNNSFLYNGFNQGGCFVPWHPEKVNVPVKLCGYFQYLPAIIPVLPDLVKEFNEALQSYYCCMSALIDPQKSMFIHIRRGDYLKLPHYHYIQTKTYYENAFRQWHSSYGGGDDFRVFIISDDPEWCRKQQWSFPYTLYENDDEVQTLAFMSQCRAGAIIANSSFSYWGAMLSGSKYVFYPQDWIAERVYDLFPSHWVCV